MAVMKVVRTRSIAIAPPKKRAPIGVLCTNSLPIFWCAYDKKPIEAQSKKHTHNRYAHVF
jgi:hypothetical protein